MSVKDFLNPSIEIQRSVDALSLFYQMIRQGDVSLFIKKGKDKFYKGSITDYFKLQDMKEFMALDKSKPWDSLLKTIFMWQRHSTQFDVSKFAGMPMNDIYEVSRILRDGLIAYSILEKWMAPINQKASLEAIYDASKVTMNVNKWSTFNILKVGDLKTDSSEGVGLYNHLLEIKSPEELINHFVSHEKNPKDCLILTYQQGIRFDFKFTFYMFLLYKNAIYSISNIGHRLNLFNTSGRRNPGRHLDRQYRDVWLPIGKIFDSITNKQKKVKSLMLPNTQVFKVMTMEEMIDSLPESKFWLEMFIFRVIDCIINTEIEEGLTTTGVSGLLALENKLDDRSIQVHSSLADAGSYLAKKYDKKVTSIIIKENDFPDVIGNREFITNLIKYRRRQIYAIELKKKAYEDFNKNYERVFETWKKFVINHDYVTTIKRVLQDKEYTRMFYHNFGHVSWINREQEVGLGKESIRTGHSEWYAYNKYLTVNKFYWTDTGEVYYRIKRDTNYVMQRWDDVRTKCPCCRRVRWKEVLGIEFKDYRQIVEFFNVKKEDLPKEIVEHLHQQNETYVGNSILDDTDPVDEITDPWFRRHQRIKGRGKDKYNWNNQYHPSLIVYMPICNICKHKFMRHLGIKIERPEKKPARVITKEDLKNEENGWGYKDDYEYFGRRHFFVGDKSICGLADFGYGKEVDNEDTDYENCRACKKKLKKIRGEK